MKYIITPDIKIENTEIKTINVLTPEEEIEYINAGYKIKERIYKITIGHRQYEVICSEIWKKDETEHCLIIPAFLIPRRSYPIYVYIYAINLYSSDTKQSQRDVAEKTKKYFGLKTFSHTTVGRAVKALSKNLTENAMVDKHRTKETTHQNKPSCSSTPTNRFRSIQDTQEQRKIIRKFFSNKFLQLKNRLYNQILQGFIEISEGIAVNWYSKNNLFLI